MAISLTPKAFTRVVNRMRTVPSEPHWPPRRYLPVPSPDELEHVGDLRQRDLIGEGHRGERHHGAIIIIQPPSQPMCGPPIVLDQL